MPQRLGLGVCKKRSSWNPCATRSSSPEPSLQQGQQGGFKPFPLPLEEWGLSQGELHSSGGYKTTSLTFGISECSGEAQVPPHLCQHSETATVGSWGCSGGPWVVPLPVGAGSAAALCLELCPAGCCCPAVGIALRSSRTRAAATGPVHLTCAVH